MKTIKRIIALLLLLSLTFAVACTKVPGGDNEATDKPAETDVQTTDAPDSGETAAPTDTSVPTEQITASPTIQPTKEATPAPTQQATPVPTEKVVQIGQVKYTSKYTASYDNDFPENLLGTVVNLNTEGTETPVKNTQITLDKGKTTIPNANWQGYEQGQLSVEYNTSNGGTFGVKCFMDDSGNGIKLKVDVSGKKLHIDNYGKTIDLSQFLKAAGSTKFNFVCTYKNTIYVYVVKKLAAKIVLKNGKMNIYGDASSTSYDSVSAGNVNENGRKWMVSAESGQMTFSKIYVYNSGKEITKMKIQATPIGNNKLGLDITNKTDLVGICYTMWFNAIFGNGTGEIKNVPNVSELLKEYKFSKEKGFYKDNGQTKNQETAFHFWAEPAQGYYRSTDKQAHRNNLTLLAAANVDFLVLDYTFAQAPTYAPGTSAWKTYIDGPMNALLDTIMEMRAEGKKTPYVVLWPNDDTMFGYMKSYYLDQEKWADCFVYWDGNPFIMRWQKKGNNTYDGLTVRAMYGLQGKVSTGQWSFLEIDNSKTVSYDANGKAEHMTCCVASQRNYMSYTDMAEGRDGGKFWNKQWKNVFNVHPKIVTITWWNEWAAQLYNIPGAGYIFTDNFNQEYSRDIEPMKGGHGDQYYKWLIEYVSAYKNHEKCPELYEK